MELIQLDTWNEELFSNNPNTDRKTGSFRNFYGLIVAPPRQGKSFLIKYFYEKFWRHQYDLVCVFSLSLYKENFYTEFIRSDLLFEKYDPKVLERIKEIQDKKVKEGHRKPRVLIIFDDNSTRETKMDEEINQLFLTGRHNQFSIMFVTQRLILSNLSARETCDVFFFGLFRNLKRRKQIIEEYFSGYLEEEEIPKGVKENKYLSNLILANTRDHNFIVLDMTNQKAEKFKEFFFRFKANE